MGGGLAGKKRFSIMGILPGGEDFRAGVVRAPLFFWRIRYWGGKFHMLSSVRPFP